MNDLWRSFSVVQARCLSDKSKGKGGGRGKGAANLFIQKAQQRVFDDRVRRLCRDVLWQEMWWWINRQRCCAGEALESVRDHDES